MRLLSFLARWLRRAFQLVLMALGPVPVHVAFVMDGNRRYAERKHVDKATGHTHGYGKVRSGVAPGCILIRNWTRARVRQQMVEVIHWCMELGVKYITVYAFSIDNFKRAPEEVGALMALAEDKYKELARDDGLAEREGIRMRIVGDLALPPPAVQGAAARLMRNTEALPRRRATLNVCFSYTSSEETVTAVHELQAAVRSGRLLPCDVCVEALRGSLRTGADCPPVDLLLRTSGETRLSDFALWQAEHAQLCYLPTLWPDLSFADFAGCVLSYQGAARALAALRRAADARVKAVAGSGTGEELEAPRPARNAGAGQGGMGQAGQAGAALGGATLRQRRGERPAGAAAEGGPDGAAAGAAGAEAGPCGAAQQQAAGGGVAQSKPGFRPASACDGDVGRGAPGAGTAAGDVCGGANGRGGAVGDPVAAGQQASCGGVQESGLRWLLGAAGRLLLDGWLADCWRCAFGAGRSAAGRAAGGEGSGSGGGDGGDRGAGGREVRLLRYLGALQAARLAWVAGHAEL